MITELAAQVYGKGRDNLYCRLIRAKEMQDKPVDRAVSFEWKAGDGVYPPVWALWVEPGQNWAILYCFEDRGNELAGSMRPHTLRKTAGLCTRADLPLITSLAAGKGVRSHQIVNDDHWRIDFEEPTQPNPQLWNTRILSDGGNSHYHLRFNTPPRIDASAPKQDAMPRPGIARSKVWLVGTVCLILGGVVYGITSIQNLNTRYDDLNTRYDDILRRLQQVERDHNHLKDTVSSLDEQNRENHARYDDILRRLQQVERDHNRLKETISPLNEQLRVAKEQDAEICTQMQKINKPCPNKAPAPSESPSETSRSSDSTKSSLKRLWLQARPLVGCG